MVTIKIFVDSDGNFGNPVGIIHDLDRNIPEAMRQQIAIKSGFSEVVFLNSIKPANVSIFSPTRQIPFAGHALVGAAYYFRTVLMQNITEITSMDQPIKASYESDKTWVESDISILPSWNLKQLSNATKIDQLSSEESQQLQHTFVWAYIDKHAGLIRARTFAPDWKIAEDEANGSGSMLLAHQLNQSLTIYHGKGSVIFVKPIDDTHITVGGAVKITSQ
jgi:predicted PhzF superfamily epimerase YddE/YHI9